MREQNITARRRAVTGDLTSAFDFTAPHRAEVALPSTIAYSPPDTVRHPDYKPAPPAEQALPLQEPGLRPARAVPYELHVHLEANVSHGSISIHFRNSGKAAAVFHVRSGSGTISPWTYTVGPYLEISETWDLKANGQSEYDLSVYGPNGFLRAFRGNISGADKANLEVSSFYDADGCAITLDIHNCSDATNRVRILDAYTDATTAYRLTPGESIREYRPLETTFGWYDFMVEVDSDPRFQQRLAGHLETGKDSMTDPAIGAPR